MSRPLRSHQHRLSRIVAAIAAGATEVRDILAAVTPGGGKSLLPVTAAARLIAAGVVDRVCWVVPRDSLRLQAEEAVWARAAAAGPRVSSAKKAGFGKDIRQLPNQETSVVRCESLPICE